MHIALLSALVAITSLGPAPSNRAPSNPLASLKAYEKATNHHDWNRIAPLLDERAVVDLGDDLALVGRENVRGLHEWERAMSTETHYTGCTVSGQTVTCRASEQNDFLRLAGLGPIEYSESSVTFENGRVRRMRATLSSESAAAVSQYLQGFLAWAAKTDAKATSVFLKPDGTFAFGFDSATTFKRLLRIYALTRGGVSKAL
jgi:hypothetical protein